MTGVDTPAAVTPHLRRVRLASLDARERQAIIGRATTATPELRERVRATIEEVPRGGDAHSGHQRTVRWCLRPWTDSPHASASLQRELVAARDALPRDLRRGLEAMATNIERFHAVQVPPSEQWWMSHRASVSGVSGAASTGSPATSRWSCAPPLVAAHGGRARPSSRVSGSWSWPPPPAGTGRSRP